MTTKTKEEFNEKLLKLDELLMEYRLADLKEKYPNLFESLIELFVDKDKIIQQQKEEIEKKNKIIELLKQSNEFYADESKWDYTSDYDDMSCITEFDVDVPAGCCECRGGKLARKIKQQVEEIEKETLK